MTLSISDFPQFFRDVHRSESEPHSVPEPFPWQTRLLNQVVRDGAWPDLIDLPTGSGKTSVLDVALFALALRDDQPRRIVFVVDRRIVVHQAAEHARLLKARLASANTDTLRAVVDRLRRGLSNIEETEPLQVAELRGGIERNNDWAKRPDVPAVVVSTVDQTGSRILFRGYGVSRSMRPVHAGLLGNDTLFVLDEVHLARPFAETLQAIGARYRESHVPGLPDRWQVVQLSATPVVDGAVKREPFRLDSDDRDPAMAPILARRLAARKPVRLELVRAASASHASQRSAIASAALKAAGELLERPGIDTVGIVVNRVDTAVHIRRLWLGDAEPVLLTGRMRPLDRDAITVRLRERLKTGRTRPADGKLLVIATQAIEAGADFDLDALVTECAPMDSLIQRFGRVDRSGDLTAGGNQAESVILATQHQVREGAEDAIYGAALARTWEWLGRQVRDFGVDCVKPHGEEGAALTSSAATAPHLLPSHLDRWVQTSHEPDADPLPEFWLHGLAAGAAEVGVVWRADLPEGLLTDDDENRIRIQTLMDACPPRAGEVLQLPISAVRRWLRQEPPASVSDVMTAAEGDDRGAAGGRRAWLHDGDHGVVVTARGIRPGSVIVVPAAYGGLYDGADLADATLATGRSGTWDPTSTERVSDLGTLAQLPQQAVLRLSQDVIPGLDDGTLRPDPDRQLTMTQARSLVASWLRTFVVPSDAAPGVAEAVEILKERGPRIEVVVVDVGPDQHCYVVHTPKGRRPAGSEPETSSFLGAPVTLDQHLSDAARWARALAVGCGLGDELVNDLALAAELHDLGKADPRFQAMLRYGSTGGSLLAKSAIPREDYRRRRRAAVAAGYPEGTRHELTSVALVQDQPWLYERANDVDLVLHLIASHHGYGRPFMPWAHAGSQPVDVVISHSGLELRTTSAHGLVAPAGGVPDRFWRCVRRYGWYGLAWLEALLRLADHRASEEAEQ